MRSNQVVGLIAVTQGPCKVVREVAELDPSIPYTHAPSSKEAFARILGEARHLQQAREDEMGRAMLVHLTSAEPHEVRILQAVTEQGSIHVGIAFAVHIRIGYRFAEPLAVCRAH